ncbi:MAG TPA: LysE family transporter [Dehalococcoidales bacterium]|nr:LysE family transporter [Dehalococcoidales bacterium]
MLPVILSVLAVSLTGVMTPGPMFAVTVAKSYRSPWAGAKIALGHAIIEVPIILLIYFGFTKLFQHTTFQIVLSIVGGAMLVWMGIGMFRSRKAVVEGGKDMPYGAVTAGIVMSATNPFFLLWWATAGSMLVMKFSQFGVQGLPIFIATHWICDLVWLSLVSVVIFRTKNLWGNKLQSWILIACSLLMFGFGIWFMFSGIRLIF